MSYIKSFIIIYKFPFCLFFHLSHSRLLYFSLINNLKRKAIRRDWNKWTETHTKCDDEDGEGKEEDSCVFFDFYIKFLFSCNAHSYFIIYGQ